MTLYRLITLLSKAVSTSLRFHSLLFCNCQSPPEHYTSWPEMISTNLSGFMALMVHRTHIWEKWYLFRALFKIFKKIVLFYYIFTTTLFSINLSADLSWNNGFRFVWYATLYSFAKELKNYFLVILLYCIKQCLIGKINFLFLLQKYIVWHIKQTRNHYLRSDLHTKLAKN